MDAGLATGRFSRPAAAPYPLRDRGLHRGLAFALGFLLPLLTLKTGYYGTPVDLASRVALVDFACILALGALCLRGSPAAVPAPGWVYAVALGLSLFPALVVWPGPEFYAWTQFMALVMAFLFYVVGLNIGRSPDVTAALLKGVCAVTLLEAVVVFHDYFLPGAQWFPDPMEGRARGTFKANGQLGAYGFCAAGLLLTMGSAVASPRLRRLCVACGFLAATFVFTASRRTGMICVFLWAALFALLGLRFARRPFYRVFAGLLLAALAVLGFSWGVLTETFVGKRLDDGLRALGTSDGFIQNQHRAVLRTAGDWFPFGFGPGRGNLINPTDPGRHEVHNGLLAVLVELGVLGFLGFVAMILRPLFRRRAGPGNNRDVQQTLILSFIVVCFVFMLHNTLYRDRTFLLFLGMASAVAQCPGLPGRREPEVAS